MKRTLKKIVTVTLIGACLTTTVFAKNGNDFKNPGKPQMEQKMRPGLMKFDELKGILKTEEKDNTKKIYVYTSANKKVLVETERKFNFDKKPCKDFDKKEFKKENKGKNKDFPKMDGKEFSKDKDKNKDFPKMNDKEFAKDKDNGKDFPKMNGKDFNKKKDKDFSKKKDKDFDKFSKKTMNEKYPYFSKNAVMEELISLNGKPVNLIGKYNAEKNTFYVCGMLKR